MPINSFLYPGAKFTPTYEVANSLRFDIGSTDYLNRTSGTSTNTNAWSLSMWIKRGKLDGGVSQKVFSAGSGSTDRTEIYFYNDKLNIYRNISGSEINIDTSMVFRDLSAWYHTLWVWNGTAITLYVNGASVTLSATNLGTNKINGSSTIHRIGIQHDNSSQNFGGYLAEIVFLDGTTVSDATSFGEFDSDTNIWKPIDVSGLTFGNNGFYLDFENSGSLGADVSGNGNNFTVNNLTSVDQSSDSCTNNFATLNPLNGVVYSSITFSEGNLKAQTTAGKYAPAHSTMGFNTGKWYAEFKATDAGNWTMVGIVSQNSTASGQPLGYFSDSYAYIGGTAAGSGNSLMNNDTNTSYASTYGNGDIISVAVDCDNNKLYFGLNGTWLNSGNPESGATGTGAAFTISSSPTSGFYYFAVGNYSGSQTPDWEANFGSPAFSISSGNSDGNGYGNFEYSVPSGYYALNTKNLAEYG